MQTQIEIRGYLVGPIWLPPVECFKSFTHSVSGDGTLREHVLAATRDGDFQHCAIAQGELVIRTVKRKASGTIERKYRAWPLERFPSIKDCLHSDPDWTPPYDYD